MREIKWPKFLKSRRNQWLVVLGILLIVLLWSSSIRLSNWDLLTDSTTGEKIPTALDPFYFLRISEAIVDTGGDIGEFDPWRYPSQDIPYINEIMPQVVVGLYHVANVFGDYTIQEVNVFSPVFFFFIGVVLFFLLTYVLTRSKVTALISSIFLAFIPAYLYRTMAGFSDHEAIGMVGFFAAMLAYAISILIVSRKRGLKISVLLGAFTAFFTALSIAFWGGVANFLFMIIPFAFLLLWMSKMRNRTSFMKRGLVFYFVWLILSPLFGMISGYGYFGIVSRFITGTQGLVSLFVLGYIIVDSVLIKYRDRISFVKGRYREIYTLGGVLILGLLGLTIIGKNIFSIISEIWIKIFHPWGVSRVSLTVAENAQPYLVDWISQSGTILFWLFFLGSILVGFEMAKGFEKRRSRWWFSAGWVILVCGILFSRISSSSIMNGTNFISQVVYIGGIIVALGIFLKVYFNDSFKISPMVSLVASWVLFMLITGRASQRVFFVISPLVAFMAGYAIVKLWHYYKGRKGELFSVLVGILLVLSVLGGAYAFYDSADEITGQAKGIAPSANEQWQGAMSWVRENTEPHDIFVHWWDYGYWVQGLGKRRTLTDGGHAVKYWDHLIGRYLLTGQDPAAAYSFLKAHDAAYLLLDPTDVGKYPAYSSIGSDEGGKDRYSAIPSMLLDPGQTVVEGSDTILVYGGGVFVDEDINLIDANDQKIFLPAEKAGLAGILWKRTSLGNSAEFSQPLAIFTYNNQRYDIPIRYVHFQGQFRDYGSGLEAAIKVVPSFDGNNFNEIGSVVYLSPKVTKGLFAQVYLLEDPFGNYGGLNLDHSEDDFVVENLRNQGAPLDEFIYFHGLRGPIKIFEINPPENIEAREEFLRTDGEYAEFDELNYFV